MKKADLIFLIILCAIVCPFLISKTAGEWFEFSTKTHPYLMAFAKFSILATIGEMIGLRIKNGYYLNNEFGLIPRMLVWGILGVGIASAMRIFAIGTPQLLESYGIDGVCESMKGGLSFKHILGAFSISVAMNCIFAPLFMTFHKITDTHISSFKGSLVSIISPIELSNIITNLNWKVQWNFVFKKTIPFFWIPAHTITFLLPPEYRVLMAASLGVALGILLSIAAILSKQK